MECGQFDECRDGCEGLSATELKSECEAGATDKGRDGDAFRLRTDSEAHTSDGNEQLISEAEGVGSDNRQKH